MSDMTRPFVDRRLAFHVLIDDPRGGSSDEQIKSRINDALETTGLTIKIDRAIGKNKPPQVKLITNESALVVSTIKTMETVIRDVIRDDLGMDIAVIQVQSVALSPGDKVRNTIGI